MSRQWFGTNRCTPVLVCFYKKTNNSEKERAGKAAVCRRRAQPERSARSGWHHHLRSASQPLERTDLRPSICSAGRPRPAGPRTFQFLGDNAALVVGVVDDRRWGGRAEALLFQPPAMAFLPRQHPLLALPLVQVIPSLGKVHVQPPRVLLVGAGAQPDAVAWQRRQQRSERTGDFP